MQISKHLLVIMFLCLPVHGQEAEKSEAQDGCTSRSIIAVTDQPTLSTSTETTQCGVIEFLAGPERVWAGRGVHQDDLSESIQFGISRSLDFHYAGTGFFTTGREHSGNLSGVADTNLGLRYRFNGQKRFRPSVGVLYNIKVPTANPRNGLSTGRYDHAIGLLVSKEVSKVHLDFNLIPQIVGRSDATGFDRNAAIFLFGEVPLHRRLTLVGGGFGFTPLNDSIPAYASTTLGLTWRVRQNLILDVGADEGVTSFAPRKRIGFGFTYAPANAYRLFMHDQDVALKNGTRPD